MRRYGARRTFLLPLAVLMTLAFLLGALYLAPDDARTQTGASVAQVGVGGEEPVARVASRLGPSAVQINVSGVRETPYTESG